MAGPALPGPRRPHPWKECSCDHPLSSREREGQAPGPPQSAGLKTLWLGVGRRAASPKSPLPGCVRPLVSVRWGTSQSGSVHHVLTVAEKLPSGSRVDAGLAQLRPGPPPLGAESSLGATWCCSVLSLLSQGWWVISIKMTSWQMDRASVHRSSREGSRGCHLTSWWPQQTWLRAQRCSAWGRAFRGHIEVQRLALGPQVAAGRLRWWESSAGCGIPPIVLRGTLFIHPHSFSAGHTWPRRRGQVF